MGIYDQILASINRGYNEGLDYLSRNFLYLIYIGIVFGVLVGALFVKYTVDNIQYIANEVVSWSEPREWRQNPWDV